MRSKYPQRLRNDDVIQRRQRKTTRTFLANFIFTHLCKKEKKNGGHIKHVVLSHKCYLCTHRDVDRDTQTVGNSSSDAKNPSPLMMKLVVRKTIKRKLFTLHNSYSELTLEQSQLFYLYLFWTFGNSKKKHAICANLKANGTIQFQKFRDL